uniref:Uncharacterized protein n=1 Tax=Arundo donax TaxID=35708 RepID=A0A0A9GUE3_ARUDO
MQFLADCQQHELNILVMATASGLRFVSSIDLNKLTAVDGSPFLR